MLSTKWFNSKLNVIILAFCLVLTSFSFVFADDSAPDPVQVPAAELSEEEQEFINNASDDRDLIIRQSVVDAVRATSSTYTLDDIYSLLIALVTTQHSGLYEWKVYDTTIYNQINNNFSHYDSYTGNTYDTGAMLWLVLSHLNNLDTDFTPALSSNPSMYELTADIDDTLNSLWLAFQAHAAAQVNYSSALWYNSIGVAESAYKNWQTSANIFTSLNNNIKPLVSNIDTNITSISSNISNIASNTNTISNNLSNFNNDFNNINWNNSFNGKVYDSSLNVITSRINLNNTSDYYYFGFDNLNNSTFALSLISLPVTKSSSSSNSNYNISFYTKASNNTFVPIRTNYYNIEYYDNYLEILIYNLYLYYGNLYIKFSINSGSSCLITPSFNYYLRYLNSDNADFYPVYNYLIDTIHYKTWKELYASDDIINAKEAQKPLEDSVLEDFTGSGSASASVADAVNIKGVQSSVKGSLDTGSVSASGLATVLNTSNPSSSSSFFSFWTSSVADDINGVQNIVQTRDVVYTHIDDSREFEELVRGQSW